MKAIYAEYQQLKLEGPKFQHPEAVASPMQQSVVRKLEQLQLKRAQVTMMAKSSEISPRMKFQDLWKVDPKEVSSELKKPPRRVFCVDRKVQKEFVVKFGFPCQTFTVSHTENSDQA
jgi:hypothetical protein